MRLLGLKPKNERQTPTSRDARQDHKMREAIDVIERSGQTISDMEQDERLRFLMQQRDFVRRKDGNHSS
jgi:hypothetical protein